MFRFIALRYVGTSIYQPFFGNRKPFVYCVMISLVGICAGIRKIGHFSVTDHSDKAKHTCVAVVFGQASRLRPDMPPIQSTCLRDGWVKLDLSESSTLLLSKLG